MPHPSALFPCFLSKPAVTHLSRRAIQEVFQVHTLCAALPTILGPPCATRIVLLKALFLRLLLLLLPSFVLLVTIEALLLIVETIQNQLLLAWGELLLDELLHMEHVQRILLLRRLQLL